MLGIPTIRFDHVLIMGSIRFQPIVDPRSTGVGLPDTTQRSSCRLVSSPVSCHFQSVPLQPPHSQCRDPRRDVESIVSDAFDVDIRGWRRWACFLEREGCLLKTPEKVFSLSNNLSTYGPEKNNLPVDQFLSGPWCPKSKINSSLLPNFWGYFHFWEDLPSTFPKSECVFSASL